VRVDEIFVSIQGESTHAGWPCAFARLAGCPLACRWCDTLHAREEDAGVELGPDEVLARLLAFGTRHVEVTGGEPLAQPETLALLRALCEAGRTVLLETSGALDIAGVDPRVHVILDVKCPSSGMTPRMRWENLALLGPRDEVKLVVADRDDYEFARRVLEEHDLAARCTALLSPAHGIIDPSTVAGWILEDRLPVRLQLQLHRHIWPGVTRGV
jgi:7-carboxy-7-deazaguanine synthase